MKILIKESQYKLLVEQTTPPTTTPVPATTTTTPPATGRKPMYGTAEQRVAAKKKREGQRKINFDNFSNFSKVNFDSSCVFQPRVLLIALR